MAGINVGRAKPGHDVEGPVVRHAYHQIHRPHCVPHSIEWLDKTFLVLGQEFGVFFLNVCRVSEHDGAEISRCGCRPYGPRIAFGNEKRQASGVINMRVRQDDCVEICNWQRKLSIFLR